MIGNCERDHNIYERLEIKDYFGLDDFLYDVADRNTLTEENDEVIIFGNIHFINECIIKFVNMFGYELGLIDLVDKDSKDEYGLAIHPLGNTSIIYAEPVRTYYDGQHDYIKDFTAFNTYTRIFINQDGVKQDLVDKFLKEDNNEVTLFGIEEGCSESCVWYDECEHRCKSEWNDFNFE